MRGVNTGRKGSDACLRIRLVRGTAYDCDANVVKNTSLVGSVA